MSRGSDQDYPGYIGFVLSRDEFLESTVESEVDLEFETITQRFLEQKESDEID